MIRVVVYRVFAEKAISIEIYYCGFYNGNNILGYVYILKQRICVIRHI